MEGLDPKNVEYTLSKIDDGFTFERFAQEYIIHIIGSRDFMPVGGIKDKATDGLSRVYFNENNIKDIYQFSIEKDSKNKIKKTIEALQKYNIQLDRLTYATNILVNNKDEICEEFYGSSPISVGRKYV